LKKSIVKDSAGLIAAAASAWVADNVSSMGAALAYYTVFSLAPLLLMIIAIAGMVFGNDTAQSALLQQFSALIGNNGAEAVRVILNGAHNINGGVTSLVLGGITLFIGATSVFAELQRDIDLIWKVEKKITSTSRGIWLFLKVRLISFALIVGVGFLLIVSLAVSAAIAAISTLWGNWLKDLEIALQLINFIASTAIIAVLFAMINKFLPSTAVSWRDVWLGAIVTSLLFSLGKFLIGLYIGKSAMASSFGAAGAFVVLIAWVYYSAQIFLLGTEFTYTYAHRYGSKKHSAAPAVSSNDRSTSALIENKTASSFKNKSSKNKSPSNSSGKQSINA
jgi:membrane protein